MTTDDHADAMAANHATWEAWTPHHFDTDDYDIPSFIAGREPLDPVVRAGVGDVRGKSLLHLQCHFGLDTLAWARRGATVTGVDFSPTAIAKARELAAQMNAPAEFVCCNVYDAADRLDRPFDVVFTSVGVLGWLPDLPAWARVVARCLKPGGLFFLFDGHPTCYMFDETGAPGMRLRYRYFDRAPIVETTSGSYAAPAAPVTTTQHYWLHPLADILGALLAAGLKITAFDEYPLLRWPGLPWMTRRDEYFWELPPEYGEIPLMFSVAATR